MSDAPFEKSVEDIKLNGRVESLTFCKKGMEFIWDTISTRVISNVLGGKKDFVFRSGRRQKSLGTHRRQRDRGRRDTPGRRRGTNRSRYRWRGEVDLSVTTVLD